ncbi:hypothetical protein PV04_06624 [Phialophora macrospora]|uniref:Uncharacterized protein n=1 Tax=Phialophora macrospora TaxID=1851006 RepID=A0A0D2FH13_9EURO|nr:hypothetical protein PV04_06624 [Phialophora macrospora]
MPAIRRGNFTGLEERDHHQHAPTYSGFVIENQPRGVKRSYRAAFGCPHVEYGGLRPMMLYDLPGKNAPKLAMVPHQRHAAPKNSFCHHDGTGHGEKLVAEADAHRVKKTVTFNDAVLKLEYDKRAIIGDDDRDCGLTTTRISGVRRSERQRRRARRVVPRRRHTARVVEGGTSRTGDVAWWTISLYNANGSGRKDLPFQWR